ncbi:MAG: crotonase [Thermoproteota archaeon]|nr:MAG: crotonase [Candidatus Korarchaeota archaeon]
MYTDYRTLRVERERGIVWIYLNRPDKLNAFNIDMLKELSELVDEINEDREVKCVVITGEGEKAFCAGADLEVLSKLDSLGALEFSEIGQKLMKKIEGLRVPVIAAINGYALGGGFELALACDFRIAAEDAQLGSPEVKLGIIPGWGATQRLARLIGLSRAMELLMLGERIPASKALEIGLVHKVVPKEKLRDEVRALAERIVEGPAVAQALIKRTLILGSQVPLDVGLELEKHAFSAVFSTEDAKEGLNAFLSRRKPEFKGK